MSKIKLSNFFLFIGMLLLTATANAQITFVAQSNASTTTTTLTFTKPVGLAPGDVMFANMLQANNAPSALSDAARLGWKVVAGGQLVSTGGNEWWGTLLWKVANATDVAATNFAFNLDADADFASGGLMAFRGVDFDGGVNALGNPGGPFDIDPGNVYENLANDAQLNANAITNVTSGAAIVMFGVVNSNKNFSVWNTTAPGALAEIHDFGVNSTLNTATGAAWAVKNTIGSTGGGTATLQNPGGWNGSIMVALKPIVGQQAKLVPFRDQNIATGTSISFTTIAYNFAGSGNYTYTWTAAGATIPTPNPETVTANSNTKSLTFSTAGTYTVSVTISRTGASSSITNTTTVNVFDPPASPDLWAASTFGTRISSYSVNFGVYFSGPTDIITPTFPGTTTGATYTAAIARSDKPTVALGHHYWIGNTGGNNGVVELWGSTSTGASQTRIGELDMNGASNAALGFVRLGTDKDGNVWILAGNISGGTQLRLAKATIDVVGGNYLTATSFVIEDDDVSLVGGAAADFVNGDLCFDGDGKLFALANDGSGVTQIFVGIPSGATTTLTKTFDLIDEDNTPFTGQVNGVAFSPIGSLYITTSGQDAGLYFVDNTTVNTTTGTVRTRLVHLEDNMYDLSSNVYPTATVLPVKILSFVGNLVNDATTLSWATENMINLSEFEIQRSTDGYYFSKVGSQQVSGNSVGRMTYQFKDDLSSVNGSTFFYRLKMRDLDGKITYSDVILIRKDVKSLSGLQLSPNPIKGAYATIRLESKENLNVQFRVVDISGRVLLQQQNSVLKGINSVTLLGTDRLAPGVYMLQMTDGNISEATKFVIER